MTPRPYNRTSRLAAAEDTRRRIIRATVELHARHGALGTTHEMIAEAAGVSLPTVYKYFQTRNDLIPHCTGLVLNEAPKLDEGILAGKSDIPSRLRALAHGTFRFYEYAAPWLRWSAGDATELPALRDMLAGATRQRVRLIRAALAAGFHRVAPRRLVALSLVLLDFSSWQTLTENGFTSRGAAGVTGDALVSLYSSTRKDKDT